MAIIFKLTDAGRAALVNASHNGTKARTLLSVGLTAAAFSPAANLTAVPGEFKRLATVAGDVVANDTIHITIRDDGGDTYTVRGFGLWLDDGTLLGTYSQAAVIVEKSAAGIMMLATDLRVLDGSSDISTLQFGSTNFLNPPATTERQGVIELATLDEVAAGADNIRAVTPYTLAQRLALKANLSGADFAGAVAVPSLSVKGSGRAFFGPNAWWGSTLAIGGDTRDGLDPAMASVATSNGNLHLDAAANHTAYINWFTGNDLIIGNGAAGEVARITAAGHLTWIGQASGNGYGIGSLRWGSLVEKPNTLAGYGITDGALRARTIATGTGLSGGGDLTADRTLALTNTGVAAGSYGGATSVPNFTVDAQGRLTAAGATAVAPPWGSITSRPSTVAGYNITDAATIPNVVLLSDRVSPDISGQNLDQHARSGFFRGNNMAGAPDTGWWFIVHQAHDNTPTGNGWHTQEATSFGAGNNYPAGTRMVRSRPGGTAWTAWERVTLMSGGAFTGHSTFPSLEVRGDGRAVFGPNSAWGASLIVGGNGREDGNTAPGMVTTNGNLHLDGEKNASIYLNWYGGRKGIVIGNGDSAQIGRIWADGNFNLAGTISPYALAVPFRNNQPAVMIGDAANLGQSSFAAAIAMGKDDTHWPFGITKDGTRVFAVTPVGDPSWAGQASGNGYGITSVRWGNVVEKPTTLAGYGITDGVNKAGGNMTGALGFSTTFGTAGIRPGNGDAPGYGDGVNLQLFSWYGIGFTTAIGGGPTSGKNSHWFDTRSGDLGWMGQANGNGYGINRLRWGNLVEKPTTFEGYGITGGFLAGAIGFANATWNPVGDDAFIGDFNQAGSLAIKGANAYEPGIVFVHQDNTVAATLKARQGALYASGDVEASGLNIRGDGRAYFGPNSTWGARLAVGGNSHAGIAAEVASVSTSDGNLHFDAAAGHATYLNWHAGDRTIFGNGAGVAAAFIDAGGNLSANGGLYTGGHIYANQGGERYIYLGKSGGYLFGNDGDIGIYGNGGAMAFAVAKAGGIRWAGPASGDGSQIANIRWTNIIDKPHAQPNIQMATLGQLGANGMWDVAATLTAPADGLLDVHGWTNVGTTAADGSTMVVTLFIAGEAHSGDSTRTSQFHKGFRRVTAGQTIEARLRIETLNVAPNVTVTMRVSIQFIRD